MEARPTRPRNSTRQGGVVLIVALILLLVLSILASISIRGASSTEEIANQSRQKALGQQTAEAALRFCENAVKYQEENPANVDPTLGFSPKPAPAAGPSIVYLWETMSNWDALVAGVQPFVANGTIHEVTIAASGDAGAATYFGRKPECMSQWVFGYIPGAAPNLTKIFVTTARGFGPEVGARDGSTPKGTEVWLQSVIQMQ